MARKSQIVLSKMSTAQGMYNYSANSILSSAWCIVLVIFWCLEWCDDKGVCVLVRRFFAGELLLGSFSSYSSGSWVV